MPFFALYVFADTLGYLISSPSYGGLDLIPLQRILRPSWTSIATAIWLSWFAAPLVVSIRLLRDRIGWRVWLACTVPLVLISVSEFLGCTPYARRVLMHYVYEPAAVAVTLTLLGVYAWRRIRLGASLDFLAFAAFWTALMLGLKILLLLDGDFNYQVMPSRAFFAVYMVIMVGTYHAFPAFKRWLLRN